MKCEVKLYQEALKKYNIEKLDTKCVELLEILNKLEFYEKRTVWHLKPIYNILCFFVIFLLKKESKRVRSGYML